MYKRILLKLSGEQLQGEYEGGLDAERIIWIAHEVKQVVDEGIEVVVMVGAGNFIRGAQITGHGIGRVTGDNMGMLATVINALALGDIFNDNHVPARVLSAIEVNQMADQFTHRRALSHLQKNRVVIIGGGIGRPYLTTDTAALSLALELECNVVIKTTKVDGVYDKDPAKHGDAIKLDAISHQDALADDKITVMDNAALGLAMDQSMPIIICDLLTPGNIARAARGENVGTKISA